MEESSSIPPGDDNNTNTRQLSDSKPPRNRPRSRLRRRQTAARPPTVPTTQVQILSPASKDNEKAYFHHYSHVSVHEDMLKDQVRTDTYRKAILQYQSHIADKVVVDVGCGTGILSIFCAQAGAKRVYAIDASEIALQAERIVNVNKLSDRIIVLHRRVEDVQIDEKVDVIVSEWMGYMLLHESMLGSVILARDRWLKPGGLMLPSNAVLYMAPVTHPGRYAESVDFWQNVYGIDMSPMLHLAKQSAFEGPCVERISRENVLTCPHVVKHVDCYKITRKELESVETSFKFQSLKQAPMHGFAFWFDVEFSGPANNDAPLSLEESTEINPSGSHKRKLANPDDTLLLSTGPEDPPTHWQQTMVYFYDPIDVEQDQAIEGSVTLTQGELNTRFMNIRLECILGDNIFVKLAVL